MSDSSSLIAPDNSSPNSMADTTFKSLGNLVKLLPTGTVFVFQFLNPVLTNTGKCSTANKVVTSILICLCGFSCAFSCFTDSFKGKDGKRYYGIATKGGLWTYGDAEAVDLTKHKLNFGDFVHACFAVAVFAVLSLLDANTVHCLYSSFQKSEKVLVMALPPVIGVVSSVVFTLFPSKRNGIGYPPSDDASKETD